MRLRYKVLSVVVLIVAAYALGRYNSPEKIKEITKVDDTKKTNINKDVDKNVHKKTKIIVITNPDGSKKETTVIDERDDTRSDTNTSIVNHKRVEKDKEITYNRSKLTIAALGGINPFSNVDGLVKPVFGGMISKEILGPVSLGAFGLSSGLVGMSIGVSF